MYSLKIKIARSDDSVGPSDTDPFEHKAWGPYMDQLRLYKSGKTHGGGCTWFPGHLEGPSQELPKVSLGSPLRLSGRRLKAEGVLPGMWGRGDGAMSLSVGTTWRTKARVGPRTSDGPFLGGLGTLFQARPW